MADFVLILLAAFTAGLIDAAVGGGGLIQVPALFGVYPKELPATLLGTNKLSSCFGVSMATHRFARSVHIDWRITGAAFGAAFGLAFLGAYLASIFPRELMRPLVAVLLIAVAVYTLRNRKMGQEHEPKPFAARHALLGGAAIGGVIGLYDGFFGPGTGTFLIFAFVRVFGWDFLHASASAKVVNLGSNLASVILFGLTGHILWTIGLPMAACNLIGAYIGSQIAIRYGSKLIRKLFIGLVVVLIAKLFVDMWPTFAAML